MKIITKNQLLLENTKLKEENEKFRRDFLILRKEFTNILQGRQCPPFWSNQYNENSPLSWEEIFFKIGELNSDANYTILLEQKHLLERELGELKKEKKGE